MPPGEREKICKYIILINSHRLQHTKNFVTSFLIFRKIRQDIFEKATEFKIVDCGKLKVVLYELNINLTSQYNDFRLTVITKLCF